jgi:hypothetical protein
VVVGTLAGRSEVVETAGFRGAGDSEASFTAEDSFAGVEAAGGAAGEGEAAEGAAGAVSEGGVAAGAEGEGVGAVTGGAVAASEVSGAGPGSAGASERDELVEAKCSAQLGSTLEESSRHCSRSASTSH